jgi:hypothetical protein
MTDHNACMPLHRRPVIVAAFAVSALRAADRRADARRPGSDDHTLESLNLLAKPITVDELAIFD